VTTILVVEDEPDIRELIRLNLESEGFRVVLAEDGAQGLEVAEVTAPDAIVLDVMMPGLDGWEVLARLKAIGGRVSEVPVVMLTARTGDLDRVRGGIEGAVRYLTKPFAPGQLQTTLNEVLGGEPEPVQRRHAQQQALTSLARIEGGSVEPLTPAARPRLSRLDGAPVERHVRATPAVNLAGQMQLLSPKQRQLIEAVAEAPTVIEAAHKLSVSRSNVYASLRRIARKLGVSSVSDLVNLARTGGLS